MEIISRALLVVLFFAGSPLYVSEDPLTRRYRVAVLTRPSSSATASHPTLPRGGTDPTLLIRNSLPPDATAWRY